MPRSGDTRGLPSPVPGSPQVEISLDNLVHNLGRVRRAARGAGVIAVVKDCAYGCGAVPVSRALEQERVDFLAVARAAEGRHLRDHGIGSPILLLGEASPEEASWAGAHGVRLTVNSLDTLRVWTDHGVTAKIHVNVDTGMSRMGIDMRELTDAAKVIAAARTLDLEGVYTHFAGADVPDTPTVKHQLTLLGEAIGLIAGQGLAPRLVHTANSAAVARFPVIEGHLVRPGIALYGCRPDPSQTFDLDLRPVATLRGTVVKLRRVPAGTPLSYRGTFVTTAETHVATVDIGYAHGLPRRLSNRGALLVGGKRHRIVGNVTMDYTLIDAGREPTAQEGDEVVALGMQGHECIEVDEVARLAGTIGYEILCGLGPRAPRMYVQDGAKVGCEPACLF